MKKLFAVLLVVASMLVFCVCLADETGSKTLTSGDYQYVILADKTAKIKKYSGSASEISIPQELDGYLVTAIGDYAFSYCSFLTNIMIPDSVVSIGNCAFTGCSSLTSITIPNSLSFIGNNPFENCYNLNHIIVSPGHPYLAVIDDVLFSKPDKRLVCYPYALNARSYTIPNGIKKIGDWAFSYCSSLTSITIPDSVTSIGRFAFDSCSSLTSVTIPDSVTSIGYAAFSDCTSLDSIMISNNVTSISDDMFFNCTSLTNITIPNSVTSIGESSFSYCSSLTSITIPNSVTSIGVVNPFALCKKLTRIVVSPDHPYLSTIDGVLFSKPDKRLVCYPCALNNGSYTIPQGVREIGNSAFIACEFLTSITIPDSVTSIGDNAFVNCTSLASITIPDSVTSIGMEAFMVYQDGHSFPIPTLTAIVSRGSYAAQYCEDNDINYTYPDALDWLND